MNASTSTNLVTSANANYMSIKIMTACEQGYNVEQIMQNVEAVMQMFEYETESIESDIFNLCLERQYEKLEQIEKSCK